MNIVLPTFWKRRFNYYLQRFHFGSEEKADLWKMKKNEKSKTFEKKLFLTLPFLAEFLIVFTAVKLSKAENENEWERELCRNIWDSFFPHYSKPHQEMRWEGRELVWEGGGGGILTMVMSSIAFNAAV